jgi:hypothetical protein
MTIEQEALSESVAPPMARDGRNGVAPLNGAQPSNSNDHHISENVSERVAKLVDQLTLEVVHLRIAQRSNRRIGMAMGIVMNQLRTTRKPSTPSVGSARTPTASYGTLPKT